MIYVLRKHVFSCTHYESINLVLMPIFELWGFHFCFFNQKLSLPIFLCLRVFLRQVYLFSTISQLMISQSMARCVAGCQRDPKSSLVHPLPPVYYYCLLSSRNNVSFLEKFILYLIWYWGSRILKKWLAQKSHLHHHEPLLCHLWTDSHLNHTSNCGLELTILVIWLVKSN